MKAWGINTERGVYGQIMALMNFTPAERRDGMKQGIIAFARKFEYAVMTKARMRDFIATLPLNDDQRQMLLYFTEMAGRTA
jgi:hypothetical protein